MTGSRILAFLVLVCALAVSALMAIPVENFEAIGSRHTAPPPAASDATFVLQSQKPRTAESADHTTVPRLWLR
jgi:hypothetical protein